MLEGLRGVAATAAVSRVRGVLNGTTNYVLDRLAHGDSLAAAIHAAQDLGFAEADPTADLGGHDAASKLSLLARFALGMPLDLPHIDIEGIGGIDADWVRREHRAGRSVRLVASLDVAGAACKGQVAPQSLERSDYLEGARAEENRLEVHCRNGSIHRFSGKGAGRWPTTTAVLADLLDVESGLCGRVTGNARPSRQRA